LLKVGSTLGKYILVCCALFSGCKDNPRPIIKNIPASLIDTLVQKESETIEALFHIIDYDTTEWRELTVTDGFILDLRYSTSNNFTDSIIYPCGRCFLRPKLASIIYNLNKELEKSNGYAIKLYDCYRPLSAQQKLWDIVPDATYVANPAKGSMHNRGSAVDLSLVNIKTGKELNMGTDFDHFGRESRHNYLDLSQEVLGNRQFLKNHLEARGLKSIKSEWWHYSLSGTGRPLSDWQWPCPD